ncbi:hypothetical protein [Pseudolactococcus piscium]|uniref:Zinc-ribbon domain-containing protein n=1 Tax=Pseudolactococcus piscium MKFS47 TaxID=297352 RepID=A0A0D6DZG9_9LACT|nr:hypothetical protein [Lactococcus piscium]CEN29171.1 Uncharacterized protein LACPI_1971 [Lactococcus piscium MKFS47]
MDKHCIKCGKSSHRDQAKYCTNCGMALKDINGSVKINIKSNFTEYQKLLRLQEEQAKQLDETCQKIINFELKINVQV